MADPLADLPEDLRRRAAGIRLVAFDVDGTLTDGRLLFDGEGNVGKAFHVQDGLGLRLLEDHGIAVALITARDSAAARARGRDLRLRHVHTGVGDKRVCLRQLQTSLGVSDEQTAYMGDDLPDLCLFAQVGLAVCPANAHPWMLGHAHWTTRARGGEGAARELCDLILLAAGHHDAVLAGFLRA